MKPEDFNPPLKVAVLYSDARREYFPTEAQYITEAEVRGRAEIIVQYLQRLGIEAKTFPGDDHISENLRVFKPNFVFNLVDSVYGQEHLSAAIPAVLELLNIPYTGSSLMGQALNSNKYLTRNLLEQWGVTIPKYQLIKSREDEVDINLDYPLIVKLNEVHGSLEIDDASVCESKKQLDERIAYLMNAYHQPVLIEEFIMGREITVIVLEGLNTKVYAAEKIFNPDIPNPRKIATFDHIWREDGIYAQAISYQKYELPAPVKDQIKTAFDVLRMEDYSKLDIRLDLSGRHYFIDANTNPALGPKGNCAIGSILDLYGISFDEVLKRIIRNTLSSNNNTSTPEQTPSQLAKDA